MPGLRRGDLADGLRQRVRSGLHLGLLAPAQRLPSIRETAEEFGVNPRVVLAAYERLEDEGLVAVRARSGVYVAPAEAFEEGARAADPDWLVDLLVAGLARGVTGPDFPELLRRSVETLRLNAVVPECNDDQLWSMTDELSRDYGLAATGLDLDSYDAGAAIPGQLRRADVLVTTTGHAAQVRTIAERLGVPCIAVTMCSDLFAEVGRLLEREPVYFVVSDPRFAAKLHRSFASNPFAGRLRTLVEGRDPLDAIPSGSPFYVTRLTRRRLSGTPLLERGLPEARVFEAESASEIMSFVVRANLAAGAARLSASGDRSFPAM